MKESLALKKLILSGLFIFLPLILMLAFVVNCGAAGIENTIYDSNPNHLWNRLNETLFLRTAQDGKKFGTDEVDILYWSRTKHLLVEPSHQQALTILDEFINTHGESLIHDTFKRALLQRDLWELFDWSTIRQIRPDDTRPRLELQSRLAVVIRRLALTTNEITSLPDNYAQAESTLLLTNLPHGLFQSNGDWVNVGINGGDTAALAHVRSFGGRSTFLVMLHHPGGRQAAIDYLGKLRSFTPMWVNATNSRSLDVSPILNPKLPEFPTNTQWVLVRRMNLINSEGKIQATRLVESIQLRTFLVIPSTNNQSISGRNLLAEGQRFDEFHISRKSTATLTAVPKDGKGFLHFNTTGLDPFEFEGRGSSDLDSTMIQSVLLKSCAECHTFGPGIRSVNTFTRSFSAEPSLLTTPIANLSPEREAQMTVGWKQQQFDWGLLKGLWH